MRAIEPATRSGVHAVAAMIFGAAAWCANGPLAATAVYVNGLSVTLRQDEPCFYAGTYTAIGDPGITDLYLTELQPHRQTRHFSVAQGKTIGREPSECLTLGDLLQNGLSEPWTPGRWYELEIYVKRGPFLRGALCLAKDEAGKAIVRQTGTDTVCK
jgi:hypothetical protein